MHDDGRVWMCSCAAPHASCAAPRASNTGRGCGDCTANTYRRLATHFQRAVGWYNPSQETHVSKGSLPALARRVPQRVLHKQHAWKMSLVLLKSGKRSNALRDDAIAEIVASARRLRVTELNVAFA